ncbi:hypothetical protein AB0284_12805 [Pseudarthrobacter phenanthrenivorans]|uniref:hypothetical protein n=1 Tax=Pseudarthrobacter phenanthrenivorans TaxID=361575 RepID=UPI003450F7C3
MLSPSARGPNFTVMMFTPASSAPAAGMDSTLYLPPSSSPLLAPGNVNQILSGRSGGRGA